MIIDVFTELVFCVPLLYRCADEWPDLLVNLRPHLHSRRLTVHADAAALRDRRFGL